MRKYMYALAGGLVLAAGCKDSTLVNPVDQPTAEALSGALTRGGLGTLATGVLAADRNIYVGVGSTYPILANIFSRDILRLDPNEPRYVNETLNGSPDPGSFAGSGGWGGMYTAIRASNTMLQALENPVAGAFTPAELAAARGFARTWKAIDYYRATELRDTIGVAIQADDPASVTPGALICKKNALTYVAALLDSANTDLVAAGDIQFPWSTFPTGMSAFGRNYRQVSNFIRFNRGWKGKVDLYRGLDHQAPNPALFTTAITELTEALGGAAPGAVATSTFTNGLYHVFVPAGTESAANPYPDTRIGLHPSVKAGILPGDTRSSKIVSRTAVTLQGLTITDTYSGSVSNAANQARPIAVLRDEELVLLRAQAYFEAGQLANGLLDLNRVHTNYGLTAYGPFANLEAARTAVLYDKRYSLLGEGVQRLVDLRAYGRLKEPFFTKVLPGDLFNTAFPIPKPEADARGGTGNLTPTCS
jgi:hypothetical protein